MDFEFAPDAARAARIDIAVRANLADSLEKCAAACAGHLTWRADALAGLLAAIRAGPVRAGVMALYADLVEAIFGDRMDAAQALLDALLAADTGAERLVCTLDDAALGLGQAARYGRLITCDNEENPLHLPLRGAALAAGANRYGGGAGLADARRAGSGGRGERSHPRDRADAAESGRPD